VSFQSGSSYVPGRSKATVFFKKRKNGSFFNKQKWFRTQQYCLRLQGCKLEADIVNQAVGEISLHFDQ
jgi:hypothetical protein